jgi:hypothetical protein
VISYFGEEDWKEFWTQWQKDNPDWQLRMDSDILESLKE